MRSLVGDRISLLVQTFSSVIIAWLMGLIIAWRIAVVIIAVQPLMVFCFYTRKVILTAMSQNALKAQGQGSQLAAEAVSNHRTISAFSSQEKILRLFEKSQEGLRRESIKQSLLAGFALALSQCLIYFNTTLDYWYGARLVSKGEITFKSFFQVFYILLTTGKVIAEAGSMSNDIAKGSDAVKSVFGILAREIRIHPDDERGKKTYSIDGNVDLRHVDFAYPARPDVRILKNFCLTIKAGKSTALVGQSGSGKSTIIGLIERFYNPLKGSVRIKGTDIRNFYLKSLRKHIALVGQEPTLFAGSIRDNILYGKENATEVEMIEAAKTANAHDFIR